MNTETVPFFIKRRLKAKNTFCTYLASSLVLACPLGLLPWLLPARASRSLSSMSPPHGALVVLPRPVVVLL